MRAITYRKKAAKEVNRQSVSGSFPADVPLTSWKDGKTEMWRYTQKRGYKAQQELHKGSAGGAVCLQVCSLVPLYSVCSHRLFAHMVTHYGQYITGSIFTLSLIVAIHFAPSCQPASTQLLLPWRHLISWHMNQPPSTLPPTSQLSILPLSSHLSSPLRSVTVHSILKMYSRSLKALTQLSCWELGDASWSNACDSQSQSALLTSGSDSGGGFMPCSLNRVLSFLDEKHRMRYKRHHREGARSNSAKCQDHWSSGLFWSIELAFVLDTCKAKGLTCRCKKQIWWTLRQRWHISAWRDWWDDLEAWWSVGKKGGNHIDCKKERLDTELAWDTGLQYVQVKPHFMAFHRLMIFISSAKIQAAIGETILPGRNKKAEIMNLITHVQEQHLSAKHVSYTGSPAAELPWLVKKWK